MKISRHLAAMMDLDSTLAETSVNDGDIPGVSIDPELIKKEIEQLAEEKKSKLEEIRVEQGWSRDLMRKIRIMHNYKIYKTDSE